MSDKTEKNSKIDVSEIEEQLKLFRYSPTIPYRNAHEYAKRFTKCTIYDDTEISYSACSCLTSNVSK